MNEQKLVHWINGHVDVWREHRNSNYLEKWNEYERIWRGVWAESDKTRDSERSKLISPATQQAIESHASEIEEALWGAGANLFDIEDNYGDTQKADVEQLKNNLHDRFKRNSLRKSISDVILLGSVYGTGIGEVVVREEFKPAIKTMPVGNTDVTIPITEETKYVCVDLRPINPRNFIIDPSSTSITEAMGCAIEEYTGAHTIAKAMEHGIYFTKDISPEFDDTQLEASSVDEPSQEGKVKILKYYGLVPKALLEEDEEKSLIEEKSLDGTLLDNYGDLVEAIVVIANGSSLLKAEETPYLMKDRPVVAYQDDTSPNRFWGRGIPEKGFNMQKAIDAQIRSHLDNLALTTAPMMGMDATRLPRGSKYEVRAGRNILTNGNPAEILFPLKFGTVDVANIETASRFEQMLLQATGTLDTASMSAQPVGGDLSVALSGVIKKNKRTIVNFQEQFLIPFVEKSAWRYMQFDSENFPANDYTFVPTGSLGMLAREVEQLQFINLLKTVGSDNPIMYVLLQGVLENSSLPNKEKMVKLIAQAQQPDPQQQQKAQMEAFMAFETAKKNLEKLNSEVEVNKSVATKNLVDAQTKPEEVRARVISAVSTNLPNNDDKVAAEFDRRVKIAELMLKEADLDQNAKIVEAQMNNKVDVTGSNQ